MSTPPDWSPYGPAQQDPYAPSQPSPQVPSTEHYAAAGTTQPYPSAVTQPGTAPWEPASGSPGKKGMGGGKVALISAATGVLGLVIGLAIGSAGETPAPSAGTTPVASAPAPQTDAPEEPTADTAVAPEAPAAGDEGSRANPFVIGETVSSEEWDVVLGQPREAWGEIQAENQYNEPPAEGVSFWIVPVTATYTGAESGRAWTDLTVQFVGSDARTYSDNCGVIPGSLTDVDELYTGGVAEGNVCVAVPSGADGLWTLAADWGEPIFFAAVP